MTLSKARGCNPFRTEWVQRLSRRTFSQASVRTEIELQTALSRLGRGLSFSGLPFPPEWKSERLFWRTRALDSSLPGCGGRAGSASAIPQLDGRWGAFHEAGWS